MLLLAELHAVQRSPTARALMASLGLVPTELVMATRGVFTTGIGAGSRHAIMRPSLPVTHDDNVTAPRRGRPGSST